MCQRVRGGVCGAVCARVGVSEQPREGDLKQPRNDTNNEQNRAKLKKRKEEARKSAIKQAKRDNIEFKNNLKPILIKSNLKTFRRHSRPVPLLQLAGKLEKFNYGFLKKHKEVQNWIQVLRSELKRA